MVTLDQYRKLMENRPEKFDATEINYRESEGMLTRCCRCLHFYQRLRDNFSVCEIFRSEDTDEQGVDPDYVCDLWTADGQKFPLYPGSR